MIYFENAKMLDPDELKEMLDQEEADKESTDIPKGSVPVDRLMFVEAKTGNGEYRVFPAFLQAYGYKDTGIPNATGPIMFDFAVAQCAGGSMGLLELVFSKEDFGTKVRIWDKPPKKSVREEYPWVAVEAGEQ